MDSQKIKTLFIVVLAALFAVYIGVAAATSHLETIAWVVGAAAFIFVFALGKHIWTLIPISLGLAGTLNIVPGSPPAYWGAMVVATAMMALRFVMRTNELRYRFTWLDFAILLQVLAIGQAWLRNPSGMAVFGGDTVGGKNNFIYLFAIVCYGIMSLVKTDLTIFKRVVLTTLGVAIMDGLLALAADRFPAVSFAVMPLYSGVNFVMDPGALGSDAPADVSVVRFMGGMQLGKTLGIAVLTMFVPLSVLNPLKFWRFLMFAVAMTLILLSGFRSILGMLAILFVVGSFIHGRVRDVVIAALAAPLLLSLLILSGQVPKLPFGAQRILSVLPIDVAAKARADGEKSSDWRFDMWRRALFTDRYIHNKILGDGFGYSADEQRAAMDSVLGVARSQQGVDIMMSRGSFHGFHVECIRFTGIVGLILALITMGIFARTSWKLIQYYRNRPEWNYVLYLCVPFLIHPFYYMLVFGSYKNGFPLILVTAGMLKVLDNIRRDELAATALVAPVSDMPEPRLPGGARGPLMARAR
jgi:hypothetical protein